LSTPITSSHSPPRTFDQLGSGTAEGELQLAQGFSPALFRYRTRSAVHAISFLPFDPCAADHERVIKLGA
jgi:hypothetical protein